MKLNRGKRKLALRIACFLISILMMCGLYQPGSRVYANTQQCPYCLSWDTEYISEPLYSDIGSVYPEREHWNYYDGGLKCNSCGQIWGNARGESHTYIPYGNTWVPNYIENDVAYYICDKCGHVETRHSHTWDQGTVTTLATYTSEGVMTYTCTSCGETKTETIPELVCTNHIWVTTEETCGKRIDTCTICGGLWVHLTPVAYADHAWDGGKVTKEATYDENGVKTYTCTNCGATRTESIPMLVCTSHTWDEGKITIEATYKTEGVKTYTCTLCGETRTEAIPMLVCTTHSWDNGNVTIKPTYKTDGEKTYTCKLCGETKTEIMPKFVCTAHVYGDAILTPTGYGKYYYISECTRCGEKHSVLHEHNYKWVTVKPATESETGVERHLCEECGYYAAEREISTGKVVSCTHPYPREFVETVPATCCSYPKGNVVCKECGEVVVYDYESTSRGYNPDNHSHFTATVRVEPTYKSNGVMRYTCDGCGYYYTESIPKLVCTHNGKRYSQWFGDERWAICEFCGEKLYKLNKVVYAW